MTIHHDLPTLWGKSLQLEIFSLYKQVPLAGGNKHLGVVKAHHLGNALHRKFLPVVQCQFVGQFLHFLGHKIPSCQESLCTGGKK